MKRIQTLLLLLTGALNGFSQTQPAPETYNFTVTQAVEYAYAHQNAIVNANLDIKSAEYKVKETTGIGLPQISGQATFTDYLKIPTQLLPGELAGRPAGTFIPVQFGVKYNSNLSVTANQILFNGSYLVGLKASKTYKELSARSYQRTKIEANVNVTKAYYQVLVNNEQLRLLDANITQLKQQVDQTTAQNKQGFVEKIDVDRIVVQYNNLLTTRENTIRLLALNYQLLKFQMGMPIEYNLTLVDKLTDVNLQNDVAELGADTSFYRRRIEYNLQETQKRLNELDLKNKKTQFLPTLSANASYAASYQNNSFGSLYSNNFPSAYVGLTLSVPIFNGLQRENQVKQSKITVLKSQNDLVNLKNSLNLEASQANVNFINGLQSLNNQKQSQALAQEVLRVAKIKYQQGVGSSIEVTQAQTALEDADNKYIQGLYDALISKVDLDKAYGRIQ
ncbi:TolC family protein [Mucilaginibacter phyllosphaerae]|uniref:Outer membrane protein TolC n=1 Tax=Mucilaginibacter phyllosphaerae TaxID=1812349 RepID=A0A4Y8ADT7_9SPHI|nr:TolC family protein [Mucilaginibacter phyllosphaerae]MBB3969088.1 outer membrane protein TolC [Mucilaginibacter phyllosphaerae]TEW66096.1 TolC family protein [Mucilaginibacter phyllosphaerae]GGH06183.1 transporter [Mucilaginibacter phyllosphaerae]